MTGSNPRILIAEDDRALADVIRFRLSRENLDVVVAHDGKTALQRAQAEAFDAVICDFQMPHLNGEEVLAEIRSGGASQQAVLILCTAKGYELEAERLKEDLHITEILLKPFSILKMLTLVKDSLASTSCSECAS